MAYRFAFTVLMGLMMAMPAISAEPGAPQGALLSNRAWPRATNVRQWTEDVMRIEGLEKATDTAQAKSFFVWNRLFCKMAVGGMIQASEGAFNQERSVLDPNKNLFVYGWGFCDTCSRAAEASWNAYKGDPHAAERVITQHDDGGFHTMYRLRLDGTYGAFDPRYGYYLIAEDTPTARILDWAEVGVDENLLRNKTYKNRSRPYFEIGRIEWERALLIKPTYFASQKAWEDAGAPHESVFGDPKEPFGATYHNMEFRLPRGTSITRYWDNTAREFYRPAAARANREFPFLPSGRFYRVTETSHDGNWPRFDPNYAWAKPYLATIPKGEGYDKELEGGKTIGQAWGTIEYQPNLAQGDLADVLAADSTLSLAKAAPFLRAKDSGAGGSAVLDFYSPYVLVDGELDAAFAGPSGSTTVELRTLTAKPWPSDKDQWSEWQTLPASDGHLKIELGRPRFNGKDVSIHGTYRFQIRVNVKGDSQRRIAGLSALRMKLFFETGIMSIPPLFAGNNDMRFELDSASRLRGPVTISYAYDSKAGKRTHEQRLLPSDFKEGTASFTVRVPDLTRCNSVSIRY
ncbi:MAG: hypothetical protein IT169_07745 [Bryobacterales bacterium]|nr:hypothetical protein [Bryobacterales bacterium]